MTSHLHFIYDLFALSQRLFVWISPKDPRKYGAYGTRLVRRSREPVHASPGS